MEQVEHYSWILRLFKLAKSPEQSNSEKIHHELMAPINSSSYPLAGGFYRPDLLDFLIALLLIKSNSRGLSLRDHLSQLHGCIRKGQRPSQNQGSRHVDAAAYWRDALTEFQAKSVETQLMLRARISELERQLDGNNETDDLASISQSSLRKRRKVANEPPEASNSRIQKRARTKPTATALSRQEEPLARFVREIESSECDAQGRSFLEHLFKLQEILAQREYDPGQLATALCHTSTGIFQLIASVDCSKGPLDAWAATVAQSTGSRNQKSPTNTPDLLPDSNGNKLRVVSTAFPCLLKGLRKLDTSPDCGTARGHVIWSFVKVFDVLLGRICDLSAAQASINVVPLQSTRFTSQPTSYTLPSDNVLRLCELAVTLIKILDTTRATDLEILEGFTFLLLQRVGRGLNKLVFGAEDVELFREQRVHSMHASSSESSGHSVLADQKLVEAQAPCLIWILERTWAVTAKLSQSSRIKQISNSSPIGLTPTSATTSLSTVARHRLQHTLIAAVFGDQVRADFQPALKPAGTPPEEEMFARFEGEIKSYGVKDWFKHKVWRLIGWEVLKGHLEFQEDGS
ncbi:hypothetical protein N7G274_000033 [Stereocaulon virgatum]|uniref:Uncharacterized protein n=1 Tax=Stereocaulon virgatum TaxID=373712 RepID=A0ABR4ATE8_9LECA